ncbi:MAG: pitrilysin family protein [Phreatobacter sp.]|uniref:M16 family metallopeptidase n=1 Tax=Phreatobacter sp. TaxID=1966341 RepID=UPI002736EB53|nr:pitrilysin family protein [Phreatobacter sp.]MDP2803843.1 pitrilysin family protein [Phreatobacter sp.]
MFTTALSALAAPALLPSAAQAAVPVERAYRHVLANGLEVVAIPDHRVPVVTHMLWYKVGSADEEPGKSGLAHFLEHLLFKGTTRNPAPVFSRAISAAGGQENAFTSYDYTGYFQRIAREQLPVMMDFEADRMTGLVLTDAVVLPERDVVLEERRQRIDNEPGARLGERMQARLWGETHPYGIPIIGFEHEIRQLNLDDAMAFYRRHYAPNNAILVVAGDVSSDTVFRLAAETYGRMDANPRIVARTRPPAIARTTRERVRLADQRVRQPSLSHTHVVPSYRSARPGEAEALEVLAQVVGTSPNGRIYKTLVSDREMAVSAGCFYAGSALGDGRFGMHAAPRPGVSIETLETAMLEVAARVAGEGVRDDEIARAKTRLIAESVYSQDSQASMARMYGAALTSGSSMEDLQQWVERIRAVSREQINAMAPRAFDFSRAVTGELARAERS